MRSAVLASLVIAAWLAIGSAPSARADYPWSGLTGPPPAVGTPEWWKKHADDKVFVPGQGYTVPGVDGYFDGNGRPMNRIGAVATNPTAMPDLAIAHPDAEKDKEEEGLIPGLDPSKLYKKTKTAVGLGSERPGGPAGFCRRREAIRRKELQGGGQEI